MENREILFRGKRKDIGEWAEGDLFHNHDGRVFVGELVVDDYTDGRTADRYTLGINFAEVIPETVGQFTAQIANGTKLFDGDIFRYGDELMAVEWNTPDGRYVCRSLDGTNWETPFEEIHWACAEIIGNIHDNPELWEDRHGEE